ncbi:eukaryotic translation initiation factor 3 subunit H-like [Mya arenaria]|uniref:eukaryotic translation initiation factor 3 subunit H-like n=1 Tax=Mya arenaria TaxID=6604 RepID=UPI0022E7CC26|nr:eukaryotic translation initiation factor 3 subunit H-like [Mya arenaria]
MASKRTFDSPVKYVQIDGLVVLKIIKHCQEEGTAGQELVQGVLLGLVVDNRLEITNCFPFPRHNDDEDFDEVQYQMEMMRNLRKVNIDHLHVGWYQSTYFGGFINRALLDSQYNYQHSIEESVVLIYDPLKTTQGYLSLKAYRLTPEMMKFYGSRDQDFSPEAIKAAGMSYEKMFMEIPVHIKNSHLVNSLLCEIDDKLVDEESSDFLDLGTSSMLEKNLKLLMESVDEVAMDANKYVNFQRQLQKQKVMIQQYQAKRTSENQLRIARGEKPLPDEDINKIFKPLQTPARLDNLLITGQIDNYSQQIGEFAAQSFGKLFLAESLQEQNPGPST